MKLARNKMAWVDRGIWARGLAKGVVYGISYTHGGKRIRETAGPTLTAARALLAKRKTEIDEGRYKRPAPRRLSPTLETFADQYLEHAKATKKSWQFDDDRIKQINPHLGKKRLAKITAWNVEQFKAARRAEVSPRTVNHDLQVLSRMFTMAIRWGVVDRNPVAQVDRVRDVEKPVRVVSADEERRILAAASPHLRDLVIVALNTGLRRGELLALTVADVDLSERVVRVAQSKSGRVRFVPLNVAAFEVLKRRRRDPVFSWNGQPIADVKTAWRQTLKRAGVTGVRFHDLRHTFATRAVLGGADLVNLRDVLGHSSLSTTQRYTHPSPDGKRRVVEAVNV